MRIKTDPTIRTLQGKFPKSSLIMQNLSGKRFTSAKAYAVPSSANVQAHQSKFKTEAGKIYNVLSSCAPAFLSDLQLYTSLFNQYHVPDNKLPIPYQNIFSIICYAAQKATSFDLTTLNGRNFYMLVDCQPTIKCFIAAGYIPSVGTKVYAFNSLMHHYTTGDVVYCENPDLPITSEITSFYEVLFTPEEYITQQLKSFIQVFNALSTTGVTTPLKSFIEIIDQ